MNRQVETKTPMPSPSPTPPFNTSDPQSMAAVLAVEEQQETLVAVQTEEEQFYVVHKYCTFLNNASIPFLPGDARWSLLAFQVSKKCSTVTLGISFAFFLNLAFCKSQNKQKGERISSMNE